MQSTKSYQLEVKKKKKQKEYKRIKTVEIFRRYQISKLRRDTSTIEDC